MVQGIVVPLHRQKETETTQHCSTFKTFSNMANKDFNYNGYEYVDLGLPSGTKWATCNVGATKPTEYGLYFQWGDTVGYTADQVGKGEGQKKFALDESDYKFGACPDYTKYKTPCSTLELEDDAASANMGGDWHIPTPEQMKELLDNTTNAWTTLDGVNGVKFTSKNGKSIFIPAAGYAWYYLACNRERTGGIWSSTLSTNCINAGRELEFYDDRDGNAYIEDCDRNFGLSVRGVIG